MSGNARNTSICHLKAEYFQLNIPIVAGVVAEVFVRGIILFIVQDEHFLFATQLYFSVSSDHFFRSVSFIGGPSNARACRNCPQMAKALRYC